MTPAGSPPESARPSAALRSALRVIQEQIEQATAAKKCHGCGCFQQTVMALASMEPGTTELAPSLSKAKETFVPKRYDCLGCEVCYPAVAANAFTESFPGAGDVIELCPTEAPQERQGWPPLPGDYKVLRFGGAVAVCTLNASDLVDALAERASESLAIVGAMHTENLGIERLIQNVVSNANLRFLLLCGEDTEQAVGHLPGQSLQSLVANGLDERGRIIGARGKRPVIKNIDRETVEAFRRQVEVVSLIGERDPTRILLEAERCSARAPGPFTGAPTLTKLQPVQAIVPRRLTSDPAGYFVVYPDRRLRRLLVEHFSNSGVLTAVIEGDTPAAIYAEVIERALISRLDHAAYLGRELARAERALATGEPYVQDRAAGDLMDAPETTASDSRATDCGCAAPCESGGNP